MDKLLNCHSSSLLRWISFAMPLCTFSFGSTLWSPFDISQAPCSLPCFGFLLMKIKDHKIWWECFIGLLFCEVMCAAFCSHTCRLTIHVNFTSHSNYWHCWLYWSWCLFQMDIVVANSRVVILPTLQLSAWSAS